MFNSELAVTVGRQLFPPAISPSSYCMGYSLPFDNAVFVCADSVFGQNVGRCRINTNNHVYVEAHKKLYRIVMHAIILYSLNKYVKFYMNCGNKSEIYRCQSKAIWKS